MFDRELQQLLDRPDFIKELRRKMNEYKQRKISNEKIGQIVFSNTKSSQRKVWYLSFLLKRYPQKLRTFLIHNIDNKEFQKKLIDNLKDLPVMYILEMIVKKFIETSYQNKSDEQKVLTLIKLLVDNNLIIMSNITWYLSSHNSEVNSVYAAYLYNHPELSRYLFRLNTYKNVDFYVNKASEKLLIENFLENGNIEYLAFISSPNYKITPERLESMLKLLIFKKEEGTIDNDFINTVMEIVLRKTKKQYYVQALTMILEFKAVINQIDNNLFKARAKTIDTLNRVLVKKI